MKKVRKIIPDNWEGTAMDILDLHGCSDRNKIPIVCHLFLSEKQLLLFATWCTTQIKHLFYQEFIENAIKIAEKYANDEVTYNELYVAWRFAWSGAGELPKYIAIYAARDAAIGAGDFAVSKIGFDYKEFGEKWFEVKHIARCAEEKNQIQELKRILTV
jgi:hypothetical protein